MDVAQFEQFVKILHTNLPKFNVKYKDESLFMRLLGTLLFFNADFMSKFSTTIGSTVYLPSRKYVSQHATEAGMILAHEYVHARDANKITGVLFSFLYSFPQILALLFIACGFLWWPLFILALVMLAPFPAPFRAKLEVRGYTMSLFMYNHVMKQNNITNEERKLRLYIDASHISDNYFKGSMYYKMWPWGVEKKLHNIVDSIIAEQSINNQYFSEVQHAWDTSLT